MKYDHRHGHYAAPQQVKICRWQKHQVDEDESAIERQTEEADGTPKKQPLPRLAISPCQQNAAEKRNEHAEDV